MNLLQWLEKWYSQNCDGQWEHLYGIKIETMDNPGWHVTIDLNETPYSNLQMREFRQEKGEDDWIVCILSGGIFRGFGDCLKLNAIIQVFKNIIERQTVTAEK